MPQFDSGAAEPIGRFSEGLLLRLLQILHSISELRRASKGASGALDVEQATATSRT